MRVLKDLREPLALCCLALVVMGCSQARPVEQHAHADEALDRLQADLILQFPDAKQAPSLPRALNVVESGQSAYIAAHQAFEGWCKGRGGIQYGPIWPNETPSRASENTAAIVLMYSTAAADATSDLKVTTCVLGGQPYALTSGAGTGRRRIVAWLGPDDAAAFMSAARAAQAEARRRRKAEEERLIEEKAMRFLNNSPIGTQVACVQDQGADQTPSDLIYRCGPLMVPFGDFNKFGWRITSQNVESQESAEIVRVRRVTLLVEKVR